VHGNEPPSLLYYHQWSKEDKNTNFPLCHKQDKSSIVAQHARSLFIKKCLRDELVFFHNTLRHVSRLQHDWAHERVKYAELQAHNWRAWAELLDGMASSFVEE